MPHTTKFDPDLLRDCVLDRLHEFSVPTELEALHAIDRGDIDIEEGPSEDELVVRIGEVTVVVQRSSCVAAVEE